MVRLTRKQYLWVHSRGGRTMEDVGLDSRGAYILMSNGAGRQVKVYVPEDKKRFKQKTPLRELSA